MKIEDIFKYKARNWDIYQKLLELEYFIPFVGAGLSIDMGLGGWNDLLISLAKYVFDDQTLTAMTDIELEQHLDDADKCLIWKTIGDLQNCDERDNNNPQEALENIKNRIQYINDFVEESREKSTKSSAMQYFIFKKLLFRESFFSSYEAAELLKNLNRDDEDFYGLLYNIVYKNKTDNGWSIGPDKAVWWLAKILEIMRESPYRGEYRKNTDCFTTNYDDILESACDQNKEKIPKITHLHGYFDAGKKPIDICLTLSDLLEKYGTYLNNGKLHRNYEQINNVITSNIESKPFLFLGTSFSESHIGRVMFEFGISYGIVPWTENKSEQTVLLEKLSRFSLGKAHTVFYPVIDGSHEALVRLLHQLTRDLNNKLWNNWLGIEDFSEITKKLHYEDRQVVENAINWLKEPGSRILHIQRENIFYFEPNSQERTERTLYYNDLDFLYDICMELKKTFSRPDWSEYSEIEDDYETTSYDEDCEPLGNTIYIYRKAYRKQDNWNEFKRKVENWYAKEDKKDWEYKIVRFILTDLEQLNIQGILTKKSLINLIPNINTRQDNENIMSQIYSTINDVWNDILQAAHKEKNLQKTEDFDIKWKGKTFMDLVKEKMYEQLGLPPQEPIENEHTNSI